MENLKITVGTSKVQFTIELEFMSPEETDKHYLPDPQKILGYFQKHCVEALKARRKACMNNLLNHLSSRFMVTEYTIGYKRNDDTVHYFNIPSYNAMGEAIEMLKTQDYGHFLQCKGYVDQLLKALYWVDKPEDKKGFPKYSDLISLLMEVHMCSE